MARKIFKLIYGDAERLPVPWLKLVTCDQRQSMLGIFQAEFLQRASVNKKSFAFGCKAF